MKQVKETVNVKEAADLLGVSKSTIRKWVDEKKIYSKRHPINNYRLLFRKDIERLLCLLTEER